MPVNTQLPTLQPNIILANYPSTLTCELATLSKEVGEIKHRLGLLEGWKVGKLESWKVGRLEGWKVGKLES